MSIKDIPKLRLPETDTEIGEHENCTQLLWLGETSDCWSWSRSCDASYSTRSKLGVFSGVKMRRWCGMT